MQTMKDKNTALICNNDGLIASHGELKWGREMNKCHTFTLQGFERLTKDAMGTLTPLSDEFELCGLPWTLEVLPQGHVLDASEKGRFVSCYLKLLDVKLLPADELPYVRFEITLVNRADENKSFTRVFEHQYGQHANATWGMPGFLALSKLQAMREKFMPDGNLQIRVCVSKFVKARDVAALRRCTVADVLSAKSAGDSTDAQTSCIREQVTQWLKCGHPRLRSDATVVCNAILKDKILSRRICRYIDRQAAENHSHTRAPETCGIVTYKDDTPGHVNLGPALVKLRDVMVHKNALRKLLAHFGGSRPHAAVAACLAVDPAGLEQHINDAVGPQDGSACRRSGCPTKRRSMQERWRSVLFGSAAPTSRLFSCVKRA